MGDHQGARQFGVENYQISKREKSSLSSPTVMPLPCLRAAVDQQLATALQISFLRPACDIAALLSNGHAKQEACSLVANRRLSTTNKILRLDMMLQTLREDSWPIYTRTLRNVLEQYKPLSNEDRDRLWAVINANSSNKSHRLLSPDRHPDIGLGKAEVCPILEPNPPGTEAFETLGKRKDTPEQSLNMSAFRSLSNFRVVGCPQQRVMPSLVLADNPILPQVETRDLGIQSGLGGLHINQASQTGIAKAHKGIGPSGSGTMSPSLRNVSISVQANFSVVSKKDKATQV